MTDEASTQRREHGRRFLFEALQQQEPNLREFVGDVRPTDRRSQRSIVRLDWCTWAWGRHRPGTAGRSGHRRARRRRDAGRRPGYARSARARSARARGRYARRRRTLRGRGRWFDPWCCCARATDGWSDRPSHWFARRSGRRSRSFARATSLAGHLAACGARDDGRARPWGRRETTRRCSLLTTRSNLRTRRHPCGIGRVGNTVRSVGAALDTKTPTERDHRTARAAWRVRGRLAYASPTVRAKVVIRPLFGSATPTTRWFGHAAAG